MNTCTHCKYANLYHCWWWRYLNYNPFCKKGHGICSPTKTCNDFLPNDAMCVHCKYIKKQRTKILCTKNNEEKTINSNACDDYTESTKIFI